MTIAKTLPVSKANMPEDVIKMLLKKFSLAQFKIIDAEWTKWFSISFRNSTDAELTGAAAYILQQHLAQIFKR